MARTAPIPNMPAPPGMCPFVAVLGGGGGGGGGGGKGADGSGGEGGEGSNGSGNSTTGDEREAEGTGTCGSSGGCSNPVHGNGGKASAGDPVDVATGRVLSVPVFDLVLPGPLPLRLERAYSSSARDRDVGLGFGWVHSLAWEIETRRERCCIWTPSGVAIPITSLPGIGHQVTLERGGILRHEPWGFSLTASDGAVRVFEERHRTQRRYLLSAILDRNANRIRLSYREGVLEELTDSVGRRVRVRRDASRRITAFEVKSSENQGRWISFRTYSYDERGDLVRATDAEGHASRFTYEGHLMTSHEHPTGVRVVYRYDAQARCIETWAEPASAKDNSLADDTPAYLADGVTRAKGVHHCKFDYGDGAYTEVTDSRQVRRYFINRFGKVDKAIWGAGVHDNTFDRHGNLNSYTDPLDAMWVWERDDQGRVVRAIDPLGHATNFRFDERGNRSEVIAPNGDFGRYSYDARGNLITIRDAAGPLATYEYDERGLLIGATLPDGGVTKIDYDALGNRIRVVEPNGGERCIRYDYLGRIVGYHDERGQETRYSYSNQGYLTAMHLPGGRTWAFGYNADGRIDRITDPEGRGYELTWRGLAVVGELRKPDGERLRYQYDREGDLVCVFNEAGEAHHIIRNSAGHVVEEHTFDGRRIVYDLDASGRITSVRNGLGERTGIVYDLCGRIVERIYPDGTSDHFSYDPLGRLVAAKNKTMDCTFEYDVRGCKIRETQSLLDDTRVIESAYDDCGRRIAKSTSLGYFEHIERDLMGHASKLSLVGCAPLVFHRDAQGNEIARVLPRGGVVERTLDTVGRLERRRVFGRATLLDAAVDDPSAELQPLGAVHARSFRYSPSGELVEEWDFSKGRTEYSYDPLGQVLARIPEHALAEVFRYDTTANLFDAGEGARARRYGRGGMLIQRGKTEYTYDAESRLIKKQSRNESGEKLVWHYQWSAQGLLESVTTPNGARVEFAYDPFARRVLKRFTVLGGTPRQTRFVWDGDVLVHEVRESASATGDPIIEERTYCFLPESPFPLAHRDEVVVSGERSAGEWVYYVNDVTENPDLLVSGSGEILARLNTTLWGSVEVSGDVACSTPLRYPGQFNDEETGLSYNRYRYYDPDIGRYINADPLGLKGSLRAFAYVENRPKIVADPTGLKPVISTISGSAGTTESQSGGKSDDLHDVVIASMPPTAGDPRIFPSLKEGSSGTGTPPGSCAEPRALSQYIKEWEAKNGRADRPLDPNNEDDHEDIRNCLGSINSISSKHNEGVDRAPCPNCSQLLANLNSRWGAPDPSKVVPGYQNAQGDGDKTNWSNPNQDWLNAQVAGNSDKPDYQAHVGYGNPAE